MKSHKVKKIWQRTTLYKFALKQIGFNCIFLQFLGCALHFTVHKPCVIHLFSTKKTISFLQGKTSCIYQHNLGTMVFSKFTWTENS